MPPGCAIRLDEIAQDIVLENLKASIRSTRQLLVDDLRGLPHINDIGRFLDASSLTCRMSTRNPGSATTFTSARRAAGHLRTPADQIEPEYAKALGKMLHIDDDERYEAWRTWLTAPAPPIAARPGSREERLQWMLFAALGQRKRPLADLGLVFADLWRLPAIREELIQLLDVLRARGYASTEPIDPTELCRSIATRRNAVRGARCVRAGSNGTIRESREGPMWSEAHATDIFFVTLNKTDDDYTPTTRYDDYPISPKFFTGSRSPGRRRRRLPVSGT